MVRISVFQDGRLVGYFDPNKCRCLGETDLGPIRIPVKTIHGFTRDHIEQGCRRLLELPDGTFVVHNQFLPTLANPTGRRYYKRADRLDKKAALKWLIEHNIELPLQWQTELGLVDFTPKTAAEWERERQIDEEEYEEWAEIEAYEGTSGSNRAYVKGEDGSYHWTDEPVEDCEIPSKSSLEARVQPSSAAEKVLIQACMNLQTKHGAEWFVCAKIAATAGYNPDYARRILGGMVKKRLLESCREKGYRLIPCDQSQATS